MLTKTDLNAIEQLLDRKLDQKFKKELYPIKTHLKKIDKHLKRIDENMQSFLRLYNVHDVLLRDHEKHIKRSN